VKPESPIAAAEIYLSWNPKTSMKREKRNRWEMQEQTKETMKPQREGRTARG
jgi:hypothetical protein